MVLSIKTSKCLLLLCVKFSHACMKNIFQSSSDQRVYYEREIMRNPKMVYFLFAAIKVFKSGSFWLIPIPSD